MRGVPGLAIATALLAELLVAGAAAAGPPADETPAGSGMGAVVARIHGKAMRSVVHVVRGDDGSAPGRASGRSLIGSGVAMGGGHVLTCAGVVGAASEVLVVIPHGDTLVARVIGVDRRSNLAVLEAPGLALPPLPVAPGALVLPGEWVVAVGLGAPGAPRATFGTVVVGNGPTLGYSEIEMIQSTCPVFRGYTGGALLDGGGRLLGVISGVVALETDALIGFAGGDVVAGVLHEGTLMTITPSASTLAIPVHRAMEIADQLIELGYVQRGYLGLQVELRDARGQAPRPARRGVLVHQVVEGGPAARAGLLPGDIILDIDGTRVNSPEDLSFHILARLPGADARLRIMRRGHFDYLTVLVDQAPPIPWEPDLDATLAAEESRTGLRGVAPPAR